MHERVSHEPESKAEQVSRVEQMVEDDGDTWDLSNNDKAALRGVLADRVTLLSALKELRRASLAYGEATNAEMDTAFAGLVLARSHALAVIAKAEGR